MKIFTSVILILILTGSLAARGSTSSEKDIALWMEFTDLLRSGPFPAEKVMPYHEGMREPLLGHMNTMRNEADWDEWPLKPESFRVGEQIHFLLPLTFGGQAATYCFSFVIQDETWAFQHLEAITIRMDKLGDLPTSKFPDLSEQDKAWMREELRVSRDVWLFNTLTDDRGRDSALEWFRDGAGYALSARAWVPFVAPSQAFILYLCWEQANLRGNEVTLVMLDDHQAEIRMSPMYFVLYNRTSHLKQQITPEDYHRLFEFRWQDRAINAGWDLSISYEEEECVFRFSRGVQQEESR